MDVRRTTRCVTDSMKEFGLGPTIRVNSAMISNLILISISISIPIFFLYITLIQKDLILLHVS